MGETEFVIDEKRPWLGGFVRGGDEATFFPDLWEWLVDDYGITSMVDVGCGEGHALNFFRDHNCDVLGIDGIDQNDPDIFPWDFTQGPCPIGTHFDLAWSCEFVEHVEEQFMPNFLHTFAKADLVLMTHAAPGQAGHHHVNTKDASFWQGAMAAIGFAFDGILTMGTRKLAAENSSPWNHYARSGMAFLRTASGKR